MDFLLGFGLMLAATTCATYGIFRLVDLVIKLIAVVFFKGHLQQSLERIVAQTTLAVGTFLALAVWFFVLALHVLRALIQTGTY